MLVSEVGHVVPSVRLSVKVFLLGWYFRWMLGLNVVSGLSVDETDPDVMDFILLVNKIFSMT